MDIIPYFRCFTRWISLYQKQPSAWCTRGRTAPFPSKSMHLKLSVHLQFQPSCELAEPTLWKHTIDHPLTVPKVFQYILRSRSHNCLKRMRMKQMTTYQHIYPKYFKYLSICMTILAFSLIRSGGFDHLTTTVNGKL